MRFTRDRAMLPTLIAALAMFAVAVAGCDTGSRDGSASMSAGGGSTAGGTSGSGSSGGSSGGGSSGGQPGSTNLTATQASPLNAARGLVQAVTLDSGKVFAFGALVDTGQGVSYAFDAEVYDPVADTWTSTQQMSPDGIRMNPNKTMQGAGTPNNQAIVGGVDPFVVKMDNGKVLIGGGLGFDELDSQGQPIFRDLDIAHVWDPQTGAFEMVPNTMNTGRVASSATVLPSGRVLISGGYSTTTNSQGQRTIDSTIPDCEIYDPSQNQFLSSSQTPDLQGGVTFQLAFPTPQGAFINGLISIQGGQQQVRQPATSIFDEANSIFQSGPQQTVERYYHGGVRLSSGNILMAGGQGVNMQNQNQSLQTSATLFETASQSYAPVGDMQTGRANPAMAELGTTGDVLVVGGMEQQSQNQQLTGTALDTVEMWSSSANDFVGTFQLSQSVSGHDAVSLDNGKVLVIGGFTGGGAQDPVDGSDGTILSDCVILER